MDEVKPMTWHIILFLFLVVIAVIVGILFFLSLKNNDNLIIIDNTQSSFNDGIIMSMTQLIKSTDQCQVAAIKYFNITRRLVDIDCVRALLQQQNITLGRG